MRRGLSGNEAVTFGRADQYEKFFATLSQKGSPPYDYQLRVAEALWQRENLILRAPTGAGKTIAVIAPFLYSQETLGVGRLIYALPLRALAQGIYRDAQRLCARLDNALKVTIQTGEQPDDPFFTLGDIIITTYDQVLSGLLCGPYGLPDKLRNINGAIATGNLLVFDEFHLMETNRAFLTAAACLQLFGKGVRSVWMTATATSPLSNLLNRTIGAKEVALSLEEIAALPTVAEVTRSIQKEAVPLSAEAVLTHSDARSVVIVNRVSRAQELGRQIAALARKRGLALPVEVLHGRFFPLDRRSKQSALETSFGEESRGPGVLVTTQVVEAGVNITSHHLHTEICPMNALVQRGGRCARFRGESGTVHVYNLPDPSKALPYEFDDLKAAWDLLPDEPSPFNPAVAAAWVETAHRAKDELTLRRFTAGARRQDCEQRIWNNLVSTKRGGVADLIREQSDSIRVAVRDDPRGRTPAQMEGISLERYKLRSVMERGSVWLFDSEEGWIETTQFSKVAGCYAAAIPRRLARYTHDFGLELGTAGDRESGDIEPPKRPGHRILKRESWVDHTLCVAEEARFRLVREAPPAGILSEYLGTSLAELVEWSAWLHDLGKLQAQWQAWAEAAQRALDPSYVHSELLAHTDFDSGDPTARSLARTVRPIRPHHSSASAYYAFRTLESVAPFMPRISKAACITAVLAHHGGWAEKDVLPLHPRWKQALKAVRASAAAAQLVRPSLAEVGRILDEGLSSMKLAFGTWWPLAAYLTRTLRLSDQLATEEASNDG